MMNKKIAILGTRGIPARYGGFETFAEELAVRLVKKGVGVTVYCEAGSFEQPGSYKGVKLVYILSPSLGPFTTILFDLRCLCTRERVTTRHTCLAMDLQYSASFRAFGAQKSG
jgi:hypothetical protein